VYGVISLDRIMVAGWGKADMHAEIACSFGENI
jgi:hypothetical protein